MSSNLQFPLSGHWSISKPIQYVEEGVTNATYGVTPAAPVFQLAGAVQDISDTHSRETFMKRVVGLRTRYKELLLKDRYTFELKFAPFNSTLIKYGTEDAVGTGTAAASLTFARIQKLNNAGTLTDSFTFYKGCRCTSMDINVAGNSIVECTSSWVARQKTVPVFTANGGLTTPTWKEFADLTATPWTHIDGGAAPLTIDGVTYPVTQFHINWNNNLSIDDLTGSRFIDNNEQANKDVSGDFTVIVGKNLLLETKMDTFPLPADTASYILKTSTSTITMTGLSLTQAADAQRAEDNTSWRIPYTFTCATASVS